MTEQADLNIVVTEERMNDMSLETFYAVDSTPKAMIDFVAHFVVGEDGNYLEPKPAAKLVVTGRKIADIEGIMTELREAMDEGIVPNQ
jgi:hypothetical protein